MVFDSSLKFMDLILSKLYVLLANIIEFFIGDFHIVFNFTERLPSLAAVEQSDAERGAARNSGQVHGLVRLLLVFGFQSIQFSAFLKMQVFS